MNSCFACFLLFPVLRSLVVSVGSTTSVGTCQLGTLGTTTRASIAWSHQCFELPLGGAALTDRHAPRTCLAFWVALPSLQSRLRLVAGQNGCKESTILGMNLAMVLGPYFSIVYEEFQQFATLRQAFQDSAPVTTLLVGNACCLERSNQTCRHEAENQLSHDPNKERR